MDETISPTYTNGPAAERFRLAEEAAQRNTGFVNPESVRQALATQTLEGDPALQQSFSQQEGALSAMDQLAQYDRELAAQQTAGNQQMTQNIQVAQQRERAMGAFDPNNPSATIAQGPATFDTQQILRDATPTSLISPFAANSIVSGQQNMNVDAFNMAGDAASARQRNLGFEIAALARAYAQQYEADQKRQLLEQAQQEDAALRKLDYVKTFGGNWTDPVTGETLSFTSELDRKRAADSAILSRTGKSGKSLLQEVTDDQGNFVDILRENPDLTEDEILALARANVNKYGAFKESPDQLRKMGLGALVDAGLVGAGQQGSKAEEAASANQLRDEYLAQTKDFSKVADSYQKILNTSDSPAGDLSLIFAYMKMLDPGSTVREGEYANAENAASIPDRIRVQYNKALRGDKLSSKQRSEFRNEAGRIYESAKQRVDQTTSEYTRLSEQLGVDPSLVIVDYGGSPQPAGNTIRVRLRSTGQTGTLPAEEFDPAIYERIE